MLSILLRAPAAPLATQQAAASRSALRLTAFLGEAGDAKLPVALSAPAQGCSGSFLKTQFHCRYQRCSWAHRGSPLALPANPADGGM